MKPDDELMHAQIWLEKHPGTWEMKTELARDPDELVVGDDLHDEFARQAVDELHLADGTNFRVGRKRRAMEDYVVRAGMAWTIKPLRRR